MAVSGARLTISTVAVALNSPASISGERIYVTNTSAAANGADLGGSGVAAGAGYSLPQNATIALELDPGDVIYAIRSGAADATLSVLRT